MNTQNHRRLSGEEFRSCSLAPMKDVTASASAAVDIWPYVDSLDLDELGVPSLNDMCYVYRYAAERYDQVLIGTGQFNALLIVVVDLRQETIFGHFLLDLNEVFGESGGHLRPVQ